MACQTEAIRKDISGNASKISDPAGREIRVISDSDTLLLADRYGITPRRVHLYALDQNIWPRRYLRNYDSLSLTEQKILLQTRVAVIGAGGLGGYVLQLLARIGIGTLVAADPDRFDETNLNRQAMARTDTLDEFKADSAATALSHINPAIDTVTHRIRVAPGNADSILHGCHIAVDALDNAADRMVLQEACARNHIPLVHGAIAGFEGRVMTVYPEDRSLHLLYGPDTGDDGLSAERRMGIPAIAPALIASLQAMEVIKILLNRGRPFQNRMLHADLENGRFEEYGF